MCTKSLAGWLPRDRDQLRVQCSFIQYETFLYYYYYYYYYYYWHVKWQRCCICDVCCVDALPQSDTTTAAAAAVHDGEGDNVLTVDKLINGETDACIVYSLRSATNMPRLVTKSSATAEIARDADDAPQGRFVTERLGDAMINLPTKFEMPNFIRYGNMKGVANCRKWHRLEWLGVIQAYCQYHHWIEHIRLPIRL